MANYDHSANLPTSPNAGLLSRAIFSTNHKTIGLHYLCLALVSVLVGMVLSTVLRFHASGTSTAIPFLGSLQATLDSLPSVRLLHGSLMIFFVLTAAPQLAFGNFLLPLQIGAREMAFPSLNRLSFWMIVASWLGIITSSFVATAAGINLWLVSASIFALSALLSAVNFTTTTLQLRTDGMTLPNMPITVWAWFINAILSLLIFSILLAGTCTVLSDRLLGTGFFSSLTFLAHQPQNLVQHGSLPILWQRLFWYFAQAEVYVAVLPCFGFTTHFIATFSRKPVWKERVVVLALCGVGVAGFCVWGYHMFATGMNPYTPLNFSVLASSLGIPAAVLLASWLVTLWNGRVTLNTAMLFTLGFCSLFAVGGLSGLFLAHHELSTAVSEDFVVGHFHLVMGVAATFAMLAALFFWFPKLFGCRLNETLGKIHFWITFAGVYCIFMPLHWVGLLTQSSLIPDVQRMTFAPMGSAFRNFITAATICTFAAQIIFIFNFLNTLLRYQHNGGKVEADNPWRATTLEWSIPSPAPVENFANVRPVVYRGAYEFHPGFATDFLPQHLSPELLVQKAL